MAEEFSNELANVDKSFGDFVLEEGGNTSINLRRISWDGKPSKLDIRKYRYQSGKEVMLKGVTLTDKGGSELANILVDKGYGDTTKLLDSLRKRSDFPGLGISGNEDIDFPSEDFDDDEFHDPNELLEGFGSEDYDSSDDED